MAEDAKYNEVLRQLIDVRIDMGVVQADLSHIKEDLVELKDQAKETRNLFVGGRAVKYVVGLFFALIGGLYAARETLRELIQSWLTR